MTQNGERLENHVLCQATILGIESNRDYFGNWLPDDAAFISSLLWPAVDRHRSFIHAPFTQAFRIAT